MQWFELYYTSTDALLEDLRNVVENRNGKQVNTGVNVLILVTLTFLQVAFKEKDEVKIHSRMILG